MCDWYDGMNQEAAPPRLEMDTQGKDWQDPEGRGGGCKTPEVLTLGHRRAEEDRGRKRRTGEDRGGQMRTE